jgi:hypothetical protein
MKPFLDGNVFGMLFSITVACVSIAQLWQLQKVFFASSVEGVSAATFLLLAYNSLIGALYGIKQCDSRLVLSVGIACAAALSTAIVTLLRGGSF